jgi:excinuclease UvrABC helicase subunit UvrB
LSEGHDSQETYQRLLREWFPQEDIKELVSYVTRLEKERRILLDASDIYMAERNRMKNKVEDIMEELQSRIRHINKLNSERAAARRKKKHRSV